ncbi:MAG: cysteine desulfurase [Candidatus Pacebacteria bacterium]|nr:cysteine desulfurase [Candidatus Paceibacterota bacterium]
MRFWRKENERVYLDFAAATPLLPEAKAAMEPFLKGDYGNPSAIHQEGQVARRAVESARDFVARALQVRPEFVTFTGGGTEGNNIAILGTVEALHSAGRAYADMEVITTRIEHPSISRAMERLQDLGVVVKYVEVDEEGFVKLAHLRELLTEKTVLFSLAYANSEIGVVQPLHHLKKSLRETEEKFKTIIFFHIDAAQAPLWLSCQFDTTHADMLVLDAAKCCGPKGVGVLVRSRRAQLSPIMFGGGQEQGLRSGTENVVGIVGAGVAIAWAQANWRARAELARAVRDEGIKFLLETISGTALNGPTGENRLANNINISIPGLDTEYAAVWLDAKGFAVSTKSACAGAGGGESTVVKEISSDPARARATLRFTIGPDTTISKLQELADELTNHRAVMSDLTR